MHSLGGYRFSVDDDVAKKIARKRFPQKKLTRDEHQTFDCLKHLVVGADPVDASAPQWGNPMQVVGALVYGVRPSEIRRGIVDQCDRDEYPAFYDARAKILKHEPPVHLP